MMMQCKVLCAHSFMPCLLLAYSARLGLATALLDRHLKVALEWQDFCINVSASQHLASQPASSKGPYIH